MSHNISPKNNSLGLFKLTQTHLQTPKVLLHCSTILSVFHMTACASTAVGTEKLIKQKVHEVKNFIAIAT